MECNLYCIETDVNIKQQTENVQRLKGMFGYGEVYEEELKFYTSFHTNTYNWRLHSVCIPLEWLAILMLATCWRLEFILAISISIASVLCESNISIAVMVTQLMMASLLRFLHDRR